MHLIRIHFKVDSAPDGVVWIDAPDGFAARSAGCDDEGPYVLGTEPDTQWVAHMFHVVREGGPMMSAIAAASAVWVGTFTFHGIHYGVWQAI